MYGGWVASFLKSGLEVCLLTGQGVHSFVHRESGALGRMVHALAPKLSNADLGGEQQADGYEHGGCQAAI